MSFQLPEPWKRKLSRASTLVAPVCGEWLGSHCLWMNSPLPFPPQMCDLYFPWDHPGSAAFHPAPGLCPPLESTWHMLFLLSGLLFLRPAHQFFMKQAGNHKLLSHANDLAPQLKFRPLSNCSLTYFLWWQILNFLMKK